MFLGPFLDTYFFTFQSTSKYFNFLKSRLLYLDDFSEGQGTWWITHSKIDPKGNLSWFKELLFSLLQPNFNMVGQGERIPSIRMEFRPVNSHVGMCELHLGQRFPKLMDIVLAFCGVVSHLQKTIFLPTLLSHRFLCKLAGTWPAIFGEAPSTQ